MNDANTEDYYRARAPEYEQIYYRDVPDRRREIDRDAARLMDLVDGREVVDIACGTGYWTQVMARKAAYVAAMDISMEMLAEARRKEYARPVDFLTADLQCLPIAEASFDVVTLGFWFSHHPRQDYHRLFQQIRRPLRKNGLIWMIDNNPPAEGPQTNIIRTDKHGNSFKIRRLQNGTEFVILKNYFTRDQLQSILAPCFSIKRLDYGTYYWSVLLAV